MYESRSVLLFLLTYKCAVAMYGSSHKITGVSRNRNRSRSIIWFNPLRPNSDPSQTSHCNIKCLPVSEVMRIENMINQVKFY